jgi:hypothetical protein
MGEGSDKLDLSKYSQESDSSGVAETESADVEIKLREIFKNDEAAVAANLLFYFGIAARDARLSNLHGEDKSVLIGLPLQKSYINGMEQVASAGKQRLSGVEGCESPYFSIFDFMYNQSKNLHTATAYISCMETFIGMKKKIFVFGERHHVQPRDLQFIREFEKWEIQRSSNLLFMHYSDPYIRHNEPLTSEDLHPQIVHEFSDPDYWNEVLEMHLVKRERQSLLDRRNQLRVQPAFLKWVTQLHDIDKR